CAKGGSSSVYWHFDIW
nr:immunoglobulin heavy chain junction region [Macaca mulatta]MOW32305.1 immunoglobulin heavy chain junction region [Macaca mulatta]MOW32314.1 immunoglobulin heavy chain junction region [Macaca mulatta]MOW32337.1 immunoglobulin heavy chain junction region [Macaca mulatta]MOW32449.1 immunoglobulin heavy chain junction region [Macaca mulatta]